ncbi:MAG: di-trans,poly-cis-decaprenylcistransferase [Spirochaetes bacterium RBG_16_49_21]|nr:MAG: di-trans,poly-cis-decaprenylcistransferase [Spirochaetes bacterium RBG_16_49_21]
MKKGDIPSHVAVIMDGNRRWAKNKSLPRSEGHRRGAEVIEPLMDAAMDLGIKVVSLYAFSTENWMRPRTEIASLWKLLDYFFKAKIDVITSKGVRIKHSGLDAMLPASTYETIARAVDATRHNRRLILNFCVNYGGQQEIVHAVNSWLETRKGGEKISTGKLERNLFTAELPPVDLMIRTGGECRISNFLIWQIAYAELLFMDVLWPDFSPRHFYKSIYDYQQRERRFGGI